ncbi:MAG: hypothetical protein GWO87_00825 [Xanthomonadaceae bacterium]|nr:hypothetical protein [Rhodospirillaceae bacterium]NIA17717.1 hypothetical protein [Xanthomonadaceae bacterium]
MAQDVLRQGVRSNPAVLPDRRQKRKLSIVGIVLTFVLAIVLVLLGERILFDLNRVANPAIEQTENVKNVQRNYYRSSVMSYEQSGLSNTKVYYKTQDKSRYITYKLLIHSAFVIPVFLLMFLIYYLIDIKEKRDDLKVVMWGYVVFAFWMLLHLIGEIGKYIIDQWENAAIYIILFLLIVIITPLAIFIQKKYTEHHSE